MNLGHSYFFVFNFLTGKRTLDFTLSGETWRTAVVGSKVVISGSFAELVFAFLLYFIITFGELRKGDRIYRMRRGHNTRLKTNSR